MENGDSRGSHGQAYKDKSKPADIRSSNINAAKGKIINLRSATFLELCWDVSLQFDRLWKTRDAEENVTLYSNGRVLEPAKHACRANALNAVKKLKNLPQ